MKRMNYAVVVQCNCSVEMQTRSNSIMSIDSRNKSSKLLMSCTPFVIGKVQKKLKIWAEFPPWPKAKNYLVCLQWIKDEKLRRDSPVAQGLESICLESWVLSLESWVLSLESWIFITISFIIISISLLFLTHSSFQQCFNSTQASKLTLLWKA